MPFFKQTHEVICCKGRQNEDRLFDGVYSRYVVIAESSGETDHGQTDLRCK